MFDIKKEIEALFEELYSVPRRREVLSARARGESLEKIAEGLNVTVERVRQIEAKYTRSFTYWYRNTRIIEKIIEKKGAAKESNDLLKEVFEKHYSEMIYLLSSYKKSYYYSGELEDLEL